MNPDLKITGKNSDKSRKNNQQMMKKIAYDTSLVEQMSRGNRDFVVQILQVFTEDAPLALEKIRDGMQRGDMQKVRSEAHSLKSSVKLLQVQGLTETVISIEELADSGGDKEGLRKQVDKLSEDLPLLIEQILNDIKGSP